MEVPMIPGFTQRRIDDTIASKSFLQSVGDAEDAAVEADVFAEDDDAIVALHLLRRARLMAPTMSSLGMFTPATIVASAYPSCSLARYSGRGLG